MRIKLSTLKQLIKEAVVSPLDYESLANRSAALGFTVRPQVNNAGQQSILLVSEFNPPIRVGSFQKWLEKLVQLETQAKNTGAQFSSADWGADEDELAGTMVPGWRQPGYHGR